MPSASSHDVGREDPKAGALSHQALAQIVDATPTGMIVVDSLGAIQLANAEVERMFGHGQGRCMGARSSRSFPSAIARATSAT